MLDVFNQDAFSMVSLTASINMLPYQPMILGSMPGLFTPKPINTTHAVVEERNGRLSLLETKARDGGDTNAIERAGRKARNFEVPHIPHTGAVLAQDVQGVRQFGSETQTESVAQVVNDVLSDMRANHETTFEWHRVNAIQGKLVDGDGSTVLYNWFTEFGVTETNVNFDFTADSVALGALTVTRAMEDALGGTMFSGIKAICGNDFFDELVTSPDVEGAYERWRDGEFLRNQPGARQGFMYGGIEWINYRGSIGGQAFIPTGEARFIPMGVRELFLHHMAPANYIETANTRGQMIYAKQERMKMDKGIDIETQSNPLIMPTRLGCLIKGTDTSP